MDTRYHQRFVRIPDSLRTSHTVNPYWDIVRTIPGNDIDWKYDRIWSPDWTGTMIDSEGTLTPRDRWRMRNDLCGQYTWAIPDPDSLDFVAKHLGTHGIEMGAGTGYWAWQLSQLGVDMLTYDIAPPQITGTNRYHSPRTDDHSDLTGELRPVYFDVLPGQPELLSLYPERVLFLCWPPYEDSMAADCLKAYTGRKLVFIGESGGGCTADDTFFMLLGEHWEKTASHRPVQWWGIHDYITVYERDV